MNKLCSGKGEKNRLSSDKYIVPGSFLSRIQRDIYHCSWVEKREGSVSEKREWRKIYKGEPAALSLRQCENFSFNPLPINAACI